MARKERTPSFHGTIPVFMPTENGASETTLGYASLQGGRLIINFKETLPGVAIQRMLERGSLMGISFVMLKADPVNEAAQERLAESEEIEDAPVNESDVEDIVKLNDDSFTVDELLHEDPHTERD